MKDYLFNEIEAKWQSIWEKENYGIAEDFSDKPKSYNLVEFPYPSGSGLHVGHCMGYGASDAYCRMKRMQGFNVMFPIGWDAFGLPTENYAIKNKIKPQIITTQAIDTFRTQMKTLGYSFDWSREVNTTDPDYYKWTQWIFLQFYKHGMINPSTGSGQVGKLVEVADNDTTTPRMAYQAEMNVNWCPSCKIVLANEEVVNGACERCGTVAEKRNQKQWMLRITAYAERLIDDLVDINYQETIKTQQINWIGKSVGSNIKFELKAENLKQKAFIDVFTTRADTLFGCTYIVIAPESNYFLLIKDQVSNINEVEEYIEKAKNKTDIERTDTVKEKTGVKLEGIKAINPINNEEVEVYVADYVLASYGTGAVMAVPAHDERDFEFAKKYGIDIKKVIQPAKNRMVVIERSLNKQFFTEISKFSKITYQNSLAYIETDDIKKLFELAQNHFIGEPWYIHTEGPDSLILFHDKKSDKTFNWKNDSIETIKNYGLSINIPKEQLDFDEAYEAFTDYGVLISSGDFDGLTSEEAKKKITEKLKSIDAGDLTTNFKMRDWIFSRQHYWGEPIPIIHCDKCGTVPVPEEQLPVTLPDIENYEPTTTGESPLSKIDSWVNAECPICGGKAKRETDTMPNWAGSSWYFLRYTDPKNPNTIADMKNLKYWTPVDLYNGGAEHITLHLLYSRFWHKFLFDLGVVPTTEPYQKRIVRGIILGPDGQKMSKSKGNVINPDDMIKKFGADTLRAYIMFIGPYDQSSAWSMSGIMGVHRFLKKLWTNIDKVKDITDPEEVLVKLNQTIKSITEDLENYHPNTLISGLMEMNNLIDKTGSISKTSMKTLLQLLYPVCPHIASEMWESLGEKENINLSTWPTVDQKYLVANEIDLAVSVNGKTRAIIKIKSDASEKDVIDQAKADEKIQTLLDGKNIRKTIYVTGRILNFVVE